MWNNNLRSSLRLEVSLEHPLVRRALEDPVDRVVVADRRRDGLGPVDHDLRGVRVPERRHEPGALGLGPAQTFDAGSGPRVRLSVHALWAALNLWTSRDAAAAAAAQESARTPRMA